MAPQLAGARLAAVVFVGCYILGCHGFGILRRSNRGRGVRSSADADVVLLNFRRARISGHRIGLKPLEQASEADESHQHPGAAAVGNATAAVRRCGESFQIERSAHQECPLACPYLIVDLDELCNHKCINRETCLHGTEMPTSFVNEESRVCEACLVPGCTRCGATRHECAECDVHPAFDLVDGRCLAHSRFTWTVVYFAIGVLCMMLLLYLFLLGQRPAVNQAVFEEADAYRSKSKPRPDSERGHPLYPFTTNLTTTDVSGVGVMLHFRFQCFWLLWALAACCVLGMVAFWYGSVQKDDLLVVTVPQHDDFLHNCQTRPAGELRRIEAMRIRFLHATLLIYVLTSAASIWFAYSQRCLYQAKMSQTSTMSDFALLAEGLPRGEEHADGKLEEELTKYFRECMNVEDAVVGVSVCWDIKGRSEEVSSLVNNEITKLEGEYDSCKSTMLSNAASVRNIEKRKCALLPHMEFLDGVFLGAACGGSARYDEVDNSTEKRIESLLKSLHCTGCAFVVFSSEAMLVQALNNHGNFSKFRKCHKITLKHYNCDPHCVQWTGFSITETQRMCRIALGAVVLLLVIIGWAVFFYAPFAHYILSFSHVPGMSQGGLVQGFLLGSVITIGNQVVYYACNIIAERALFRNRDNYEHFNVLLYTCAVIVNTLLDLWVTFVLANGYMHDTLVDEEAIVRNPTMQQALYVQFLNYLFPGTLLLPFVFEPLPNALLPYLLGKWLVRSRIEVKLPDAERCMVCMPFDLKRYGDILVNVVLVILCFFLTSAKLWWAFMWLAISLLIILYWDHVRFLRYCCETHFNSFRMEMAGQYLSAVPCAALASASVFKLFGGQAMVREWERHEFFMRHAVWTCALAAFIMHLVCHHLVLSYVIPRFVDVTKLRHENSTPYREVAQVIMCNWFNTNPVLCLKSKYVYDHDPHFVYHQIGKYYLQRRNPSIGAYYEDFSTVQVTGGWRGVQDDADSIVEHVREVGKYVWKNFEELPTSARESVRRVSHISRKQGARLSVGEEGNVPRRDNL